MVKSIVLLSLLLPNFAFAASNMQPAQTEHSLTRQLPQNSAQHQQMAQMLKNQMHASLKAMNDPELIKANAQYIKKLYDALLEQGFNKEQALTLVSASLSNK